MKPLFPRYCRPLGYVILILSVFAPFGLYINGTITDCNLMFYKEMIKLLMIAGSLLIIFSLVKGENKETERVRGLAIRNAIFFNALFMFLSIVWSVYNKQSIEEVNSSSFLIFLIITLICLEFGINKLKIDKFYKK